MMEIISAIIACAGTVVPGFCECLRHKCNYLLPHAENISALKDKVEALEAQRKDVQDLVDSATSALNDIKSEVQEWLKSADKLLKEVEANKGSCLNCCRRYKLSRRAVKMASRIDNLIDRRERFGTDVSKPPQVRKLEYRTASGEVFQLFSSTDKALRKVRNDLTEANVVGVYGMGGVGKTTLVEHLAATALKNELCDHVVMVTVSQTVNLINIQNQLARGLGLTFRNEDTEERSEKLRRKLIQEKNVLIILDDLWKPIDLFKVGIDVGVLRTSNSKILLTTRKKDVCNLMDSRETNLDQLSEVDSWSFFANIVGTISDDSAEFESIREKVAKECGGLPLVLQTIAKTLRTKDLEVWRVALDRLKQSRPANNDNDEETRTFLRLKLSYDYLKEWQARYFLLCCLFPEDHNISKEEVARYGVGLNLFESKPRTMEEARGDSVMIADNLLESGLLLKGDKEGQVKMHDVMRDMAIRITRPSKEIIQAQTASSSGGVNEVFLVNADRILKVDANYTGISLMSNELRILPDALVCPTLQILLMQDNRHILRAIPATFFATMNALKVLNLDGLQATSLPSSIGSLGNIRILNLDRSKLKDVSILGKLNNLEILSLKESHIQALSEDLGQLSNLRLLDLTMCANIKTIPSKLLSSLKYLEELYMQGSFADWELVDGANTTIEGRKASFGEVISLPCLTVLKVDISDVKCIPSLAIQPLPNWRKFNICLCRSKFARSMISRSTAKFSKNLVLDLSMKKLPSWFLDLLSEQSVNSILYTCHREVLNILEEYDLGHLDKLMSLSIEELFQGEPLMSMNSPIENPVFEGLDKLCFHNIGVMKQICDGELPIGSLGKLSSLEVKQCNALVSSILSSNLIKRLDSLKVLDVNGNIGVTEVFGFEGLQEGQSYLTNLKELRLNYLTNLVKIWKGSAGFATFTNLKLVAVINCEKMTHLFSVSMSQSLQQLEDVWVDDCPAMKEIIEIDQANSSIVNVKLPKLKTLSLQNLPQLTSFYVHNANLECPSLEYLHLENCPLFTTATADFHSSNQVQENNEQHMKLLRKSEVDFCWKRPYRGFQLLEAPRTWKSS
ncbi:hypothetical protein UlMin_024688 [Ulmus minor]